MKGITQNSEGLALDQANGNISAFHVIQIEDEVEFLMSNLEYLIEPDNAVRSYNESRSYLYVLIAFNIIFEIMMTIYIFQNELQILKELQMIYQKYWHLDQFKEFFELTTTANMTLNILLYTYGFYAIYSHKVTNYQVFLVMLMVSIFIGILLTYLNV